jgi:hypothetical protein
MMCELALIFHTSFCEMEEWEPDTLLSRHKQAVKMAKLIYR